jgi:hypothetical protein
LRREAEHALQCVYRLALLGLATPNGFWLSSDYRLTNLYTGTLVDDWSPKSITVTCPDGIAIVTFSGVGKIGPRNTSHWLTRILEGTQRTLNESIEHIRDTATADFNKLCWTRRPECKHLFLVAAFQRGAPWIAAITNVQPEDWRTPRPPMGHFVVTDVQRVEKPNIIMFGIREAVQLERDKDLLRRARHVRPRNPAEYLRLLATINRRAASPPTPALLRYGISPACETTWLPPPPANFEKWSFFWDKPAPTEVKAFRHVAHGVNTLPATSELVAGLPLQIDPMEGVCKENWDIVEKARWRQMLRDARGERTPIARSIIRGQAPIYGEVHD